MKRGEIYYADLDPTIGAEIKKKRPVIIISNDANNRAASTVTILPLTSNVKKIYPFEVRLDEKETGLSKISKVQCQQIRTISKQRLIGKPIGHLSKNNLHQVENALKLHLSL